MQPCQYQAILPRALVETAQRNICTSSVLLAALETQLQLAVMLNFAFQDHAAFELADRTGKLLNGLHKKWSAA